MGHALIQEAIRYKNIGKNLEKSQHIIFERLLKYGEDIRCDNIEVLESTRSSEEAHFKNEIKFAYRTLQTVKNAIHQNKYEDRELNCFKTELIHIQDVIDGLKLKTRMTLRYLKDEQDQLEEEIGMYEDKMTEWEKPLKISAKDIVVRTTVTPDFHINKEVKQFIEFVAKSGGHENGWDPCDHNAFMKLRKKSKNIEEFLSEFQMVFPEKTKEEVLAHDAWCVKYTELKNKYLESIKHWKFNKQQKELERKEIDSEMDRIALIPRRPQTNRYQKSAVEEWQRKKEERKMFNENNKKWQKAESAKLAEARRRRNADIKCQVEEWKKKKKEEEEEREQAMALQKEWERKRRSAQANRQIKIFQAQDDLHIAKMVSSLQKKSCQNDMLRGCSAPTFSVERDPTRLLKPTKQWECRIAKGPTVDQKPILTINEIQRRQIPTWRKKS